MPVSKEFSMEESGSDWAVMPEDVYQAVISDISERDSKKYQSEEMEAKYFFKFVLLTDDPKTNNQMVTMFSSRKWFTGSRNASPSKMVNLVKAVYAHYYPNLTVSSLTAANMSAEVVNDLIGKQLRISVKLNADKTRNKVVDFMAIKEEKPIDELETQVEKPDPKDVQKPEGASPAAEGDGDLPF